MKLSELPDSKSKLLGTRLAGMKNLAQHPDFPELLIKRAYTIRAAVQFGGVLIECGLKGLYFFACQDPEVLLDTDLFYANGARVELNPNKIKFVRDDGLVYYSCAPRGSDKSDTDPRPIVQDDVTGWSAVITPCAGYGHSIKEQMYSQQYELRAFTGVSPVFGAYEGGGQPRWGTGVTQSTPARGSALVLWRDVPLRKTLGQIAARDGFYDDLVAHYPSQIRDAAKKVAAQKLGENAGVPVSMAVSYCRGMDSTDAYVGFGLTNAFTVQTAKSQAVAVNLYAMDPTLEKSDFPAPTITWTDISGIAFDCGFRSISPSGMRQWNLLTQPRPEFGWKLSPASVPAKVFFEDVQFEMCGFLKDFLPHSESTAISALLSSTSTLGKDLPALSVGRDSDASVKDRSVDKAVTSESACSEDYLVHVRNVLAKTEAELGGGDTVHRVSGRIWPASAAETAARKTEAGYTLVFPGSTWAGGSKIGGTVRFSLGGTVSIKTRGVSYAGLQYLVVDVYVDGAFSRSYAEAIVGAAIAQSDASLVRETVRFNGVEYGTAATASLKAGPGVLLREANGKTTLVATIAAL